VAERKKSAPKGDLRKVTDVETFCRACKGFKLHAMRHVPESGAEPAHHLLICSGCKGERRLERKAG
jgi:hypothetical protein